MAHEGVSSTGSNRQAEKKAWCGKCSAMLGAALPPLPPHLFSTKYSSAMNRVLIGDSCSAMLGAALRLTLEFVTL